MDMLDHESVEAIAATLYSNERPLQGIAGLIDWHFPRILSDFVRQGAINGKESELVCIPVEYRGRRVRVLLLGNGPTSHAGARPKVPEKALAHLAENVRRLRVTTLAMSALDFGVVSRKEVEAILPGVTVVWTT